jgi:eukaryotic-like serine/threonine-protein kinase
MLCCRCKEELNPNNQSCFQCGTKRHEASFQGEVGRSLGRYVVSSFLWENQFGTTYTAKDHLLGKVARVIAIKTPLESASEIAAQVRRDGPRLQKLLHPALVPLVNASANDDGRLILAYEETTGQLLSEQLLLDKSLRVEAILPLLHVVSEALSGLYTEGFAHGALSPDVLLLRGIGEIGPTIRVLDTGVAYFAKHGKTPVVRLDSLAGAWPYTAPEIWKGAGILDARTDVYSMAAILFRVLAGKPPYLSKDAAGFMSAHCLEPVPSLPMIDGSPVASAEVNEVIRRGLSKRREERFATPAEMLHRLAEVSASPSSMQVLQPKLLTRKTGQPQQSDRPSLPMQTRPIELTQQVRLRAKREPAPTPLEPTPTASTPSIVWLLVAIFALALGVAASFLFY